MKTALYGFLMVLFLAATGCQNGNVVVDSNQEISNRRWSYLKRVQVPVNIEDIQSEYLISVNLRHTADYKYSNIFLLIHQIGPDGKRVTERKEFKLAYPDGEWLGSGSGNMYSYVLPLKKGKFTAKGKYVFELEQ